MGGTPMLRRIEPFLAAAGLRGVRLRQLPGNTDEVYAVCCDAGRFVVRLRATPMSDAVARLQQCWLDSIARETDVVVPTVVPVQGRACIDGAALFEWVEGRRARDARAFVHRRRLDAVATAIALLHRHAQGYRFRAVGGLPRFDADHFFGDDSCVGAPGRKRLSGRDFDHLRRWADRIRGAMADLGESRRVFGLIHNDLEPPNWLFHHGQARPIDFDMFGVGYYLFDLAQVLWTHALWEDFERHRARLLGAYERIRPLSDLERRHARSFEAIPLIDWISRKFRIGASEELRRWLPATMKRLREWFTASPKSVVAPVPAAG
jgi:Ser/Thr protein kinase RdoA (MazF antagonist)